jgi:hypothetical protein
LDKRARLVARQAVAEHPSAPARLQRCGRDRYQSKVEVLAAGGSAWFDGVQRCRSRACPVCWVSRRAKLAHEIQHVVDTRVRETRQMPLLATLTIRHSAEDPVSICRSVRSCWRKFIQRRGWRQFRDDAQLEWVIAEEVTLGDHGWHPHLHALLLPRRSAGDVLQRADWWYETWAAIVERELGAAHVPSPEHGTDLRPCTTAGYLTKLGLELTDAGAVKGRAPLALLQAGALNEYMELQLSRHRARDLTWSRGLRPYRDSLPPPPPSELKLRLRGSEYERLHARGHDACLATLDAAAHGADAQSTVEWYIGRLVEPQDELELGRPSELHADPLQRLEAAGAALTALGLGRRSKRVDPDTASGDLELAQLEQRVWLQERRRRARQLDQAQR